MPKVAFHFSFESSEFPLISTQVSLYLCILYYAFICLQTEGIHILLSNVFLLSSLFSFEIFGAEKNSLPPDWFTNKHSYVLKYFQNLKSKTVQYNVHQFHPSDNNFYHQKSVLLPTVHLPENIPFFHTHLVQTGLYTMFHPD